ncbi:maltokinase N-terminal cap-like domain-containing protein [Jatrophihabitans sp. YIM 134969]
MTEGHTARHSVPSGDQGWDPAPQLADRFAEWIPRQRWFGGKGRPVTIGARRVGGLVKGDLADERDSGAPLGIWVAEILYGDDGSTDLYQVPVSAYGERIEPLDHALIGVIDREGSPVFVYDGLHDKYVTGRWLAGIRLAGTDGASSGPLHFDRIVEPDAVPVDSTSLVLGGEQSNTSLVYGDTAIMKVFRRLQPGINPDIEVHAALSKLGGSNIATLLGSVAADGVFLTEADGGQGPDAEPTSLAMVQEFMTTATDGWELAKISVRDLLAEADLHADEAGGDFAGEAERLGAATAAVHAELAQAFGTAELTSEDLAARGRDMAARLDVAVTVVPQLAQLEAGLREAFAALGSLPEPVLGQRVHGDLHLGQCLRTARRWVVLDFEGEPAKNIASRRAYDSALRDVAGMLRSFDYVARHMIVDVGSTPQTEYRSTEWAVRNRDAFCNGYSEVAGFDPRDQAVLLRALEADKAVYEAVYEARNRPSWLGIPLASLGRIADAATTDTPEG